MEGMDFLVAVATQEMALVGFSQYLVPSHIRQIGRVEGDGFLFRISMMEF
jgi:hypothetical protein